MSRPLLRLSTLRTQFLSPRPLSTMASKTTFLDATAARRSVYPLTKSSPIPDSQIISLVHHAARHVPSAFDSQTTRLVVLLGPDHDHFWSSIVWPALIPNLPNEEAKQASKGRIDGFAGAKGTVLFFESTTARDAAAKRIPELYVPRLPGWGEHTSAMHQYFLWTALEAEGLGANLQHYNPLVDAAAIEKWGLDKDLELKAQLVFGGLPEGKKVADLVKEKDLAGRAEKVKVFGAQ